MYLPIPIPYVSLKFCTAASIFPWNPLELCKRLESLTRFPALTNMWVRKRSKNPEALVIPARGIGAYKCKPAAQYIRPPSAQFSLFGPRPLISKPLIFKGPPEIKS